MGHVNRIRVPGSNLWGLIFQVQSGQASSHFIGLCGNQGRARAGRVGRAGRLRSSGERVPMIKISRLIGFLTPAASLLPPCRTTHSWSAGSCCGLSPPLRNPRVRFHQVPHSFFSFILLLFWRFSFALGKYLRPSVMAVNVSINSSRGFSALKGDAGFKPSSVCHGLVLDSAATANFEFIFGLCYVWEEQDGDYCYKNN